MQVALLPLARVAQRTLQAETQLVASMLAAPCCLLAELAMSAVPPHCAAGRASVAELAPLFPLPDQLALRADP